LCFVLLSFADNAFFSNWRFVATLRRARLLVPLPFFQHHFSPRVSVSRFGNSHNISHFIITILFLTVICDVTIVIILGCRKACPYKTVNLINVVCILTAHQPAIPSSLPVLGPSYPLRLNILKLGQLIILQWPLSIPVKGRVPHLSL